MISFIVPAYNEERVLGATLDALHAVGRAVGEPYEVIVADDASTDGTARIACERGAVLVGAEAVLTSGRKLRTYTGREVLVMTLRLALRGPRAVRRRDGMELWYGPRREDPHEKA